MTARFVAMLIWSMSGAALAQGALPKIGIVHCQAHEQRVSIRSSIDFHLDGLSVDVLHWYTPGADHDAFQQQVAAKRYLKTSDVGLVFFWSCRGDGRIGYLYKSAQGTPVVSHRQLAGVGGESESEAMGIVIAAVVENVLTLEALTQDGARVRESTTELSRTVPEGIGISSADELKASYWSIGGGYRGCQGGDFRPAHGGILLVAYDSLRQWRFQGDLGGGGQWASSQRDIEGKERLFRVGLSLVRMSSPHRHWQWGGGAGIAFLPIYRSFETRRKDVRLDADAWVPMAGVVVGGIIERNTPKGPGVFFRGGVEIPFSRITYRVEGGPDLFGGRWPMRAVIAMGIKMRFLCRYTAIGTK